MNSNKTILVTGGTGFLGKEVVKLLLEKGFNVRVITRNIKGFTNFNNLTYVTGDILDLNSVREAALDCYGIIHAAAIKTVSNDMTAINVTGTKNVCIAANENNISSFCYISTVSVVGITTKRFIDENTPLNPHNLYERTKHDAEKAYLDTINIDTVSSVVLRPSRIFGKEQITFNNTPIQKIKRWLKGNEQANYVYVKDVASAAVYFINNDKHYTNEVFNVSDNSVENTFKMIYKLVNKNNGRSKFLDLYPTINLPYFFRILKHKKGNLANKVYDCSKLIETGFIYPYGLKNAVIDALKN